MQTETVTHTEQSTPTETPAEPEGLFSDIDEQAQEPEPELLCETLIAGGVFFVDNSGSTSGSILSAERTFTERMGPRQTALWNSNPVVRLQDTADVVWASTGGTAPSAIYNHGCYPEPPNYWTSFTLLTDGEVASEEVRKLAQHAHKTSHLPTILGIAVDSGDRPIKQCNVSVLFSHFTAARTAILIIIDTRNRVRVIRAKGDWEHKFGHLPELTDTARVFDFPEVDIEQLSILECRRGTAQPRNTVMVHASGRGRWLHMDRLLTLPSSQSLVLEGQVTEAEMEDIVRSFHAQGRLAELRRWLTDISSGLAAEAQAAERDAAPAPNAEPASAPSLATLLSRLRHARNEAERNTIKAQLFSCAEAKSQAASSAKQAKKNEQKGAKQLVDAGLRAACALEKAGMGADALGRLSNRAARASKVSPNNLKPMAELDTAGAPSAECNVMLDNGPCALLIRRVSAEVAEENTADFALDFPLAVGCWQRNDIFCPDVVGISNGTGDKIEATQVTVLGREDTVVALPVVALGPSGNRDEFFKRLCLAFNDGMQLSAVWQVALSSILVTLETKPWAAPGTEMCALLEYLGGEIIANVQLHQGTRLALDRTLLMNEAFAIAISQRDFAQDYPIEGTVSAAAALLRWGAPIAASPTMYTACVIARAHRAVPQQFLNWMKSNRQDGLPCSTSALWHSIYETRSAEGTAVPIAGGHRLVTSWEGLLSAESRLTLDRFARIVAVAKGDPGAATVGADSLIRPGLAVIVRACLAGITNHHISSQAAVGLAEKFHNAVALEFNAATVGTTTADEAAAILSEWLLWARAPMRPLPPFATAYGPSLIYFYHSRTQNAAVTNMTEGFQWNIDGEGEQESEAARMERLAAHIRATRGRLLAQEYNFNRDGTFNPTTVSVPMYRAMTLHWYQNPDADPLHGSFVSGVVARILKDRRGNIHGEMLEHDIAMLGPSLQSVGRLSAAPVPGSGEYFGNFGSSDHEPPEQSAASSLACRLIEELAGRTTMDVRCDDAPPAIWVPREDPAMQARLREAEAANKVRLEAVQAQLAARLALTPEPKRGAPVKKLEGEALERRITKILRHDAEKRRLTVRPDGYVEVEKILEQQDFNDVTVPEFLAAVIESEYNKKRRFQVKEEGDCLLVRAVQGHTIAAVKPEELMSEIKNPDEVPICIHGTYLKAFEAIQKSDLNRMSRNEIQMAVGLPDDPQVTSGVRPSVEVLIYIDVARAMEQGIRFFRSANNVICSPGPIPPSCFAHVARRDTIAAMQPPTFNRSISGRVSTPAPAAVQAAPVTTPASPTFNPPSRDSEGLQRLLAMGFERAEAEMTLQRSHGDVQRAIEVLLSQATPAAPTPANDDGLQQLLNMGIDRPTAEATLQQSNGDLQRAIEVLFAV